ncbi:MAG: BON domain-containing protein [Alphaproteobacteria bacterium]|nr:BON domain-containing protein [Alphaproteobacteria bacterium]
MAIMIRFSSFRFILVLCLLSLLCLNACTGLGIVTGAAAVTGIAAAQEGGLKRAYNDTMIKAQINDAWFKYDVDTFGKLETTINQGRVLITGVVQDPEHRVEAVRLAWQVDGVQQVINEIRVAESAGIRGFVKDSWITSKLRANLTFDRGVQSVNYSIDTVQGIVYLMGVAQNQVELNRVIETARTIKGVKQVVSYVKLAGEPLKGQEGQEETQQDVPPETQESQPAIKDQYYNS